MHRGEHEMAGFSSSEGGGNRFEIAHLTNDQHVGVLAEHVDERAVERAHIGQHFLLHHDSALVRVDKFDRSSKLLKSGAKIKVKCQ